MTATDELRKLLDECGVEWWAEDDPEEPAYYFVTKWFANACEQTYEEIPAIRSRSLKAYCVTPEQAIAATLGYELNPDGLPAGLTISDDGTLLDWRGENYVRQSIVRDVKRKPNGDVNRCEICGDDRFELIAKAKQKLLDATNIDSRPDEIAVLDNILFRCWQMGWLYQLRYADTRWHKLFGTPERAANTVLALQVCPMNKDECEECPAYDVCFEYYKNGRTVYEMAEWLRGDAE